MCVLICVNTLPAGHCSSLPSAMILNCDGANFGSNPFVFLAPASRLAVTEPHLVPLAGRDALLPNLQFLQRRLHALQSCLRQTPSRRRSALLLVLPAFLLALLFQFFHQGSRLFAFVAQRPFPMERPLAS